MNSVETEGRRAVRVWPLCGDCRDCRDFCIGLTPHSGRIVGYTEVIQDGHPFGSVPGSRLVGGDLLLLCLRANRNLFRARSRILESYNDRGICCVGAGFPNRRRVEQFSQMISHSQKPTFSEQPDIGRKMNRSISLLRLVGFLCKWLGSTKIWGQLGAKTRAS